MKENPGQKWVMPDERRSRTRNSSTFKTTNMKRKSAAILLPVLFAVAAGFVVVKYNKDGGTVVPTVYLLQERKGMAAEAAEWKEVKAKFEKEIKISRTNDGDIKSRLALAALFIQEARVTGDHMYYDAAAMKYVNEVLAKEPSNFEALIYQSLIFLSQHHFAEGL